MNVFDIVGPVMIGPSSSHTAGAVRIGRIARALLNESPIKAVITLHGSFAKTYQGHGTDKALIGGIMGMAPDDERIRYAPSLAKGEGIDVVINCAEIDGAHPNTAIILLRGVHNNEVTIQGASVGGGNILITKINGLDVELSAGYTAFIIVHNDIPGTIAAVSEKMAKLDVNICNFRLSRTKKGGTAIMTIEVDGSVSSEINEEIRALPNIISSTLLIPN